MKRSYHKEDKQGNLTYEMGKDKRWFTGTRGNEWAWVDLDYLPIIGTIF